VELSDAPGNENFKCNSSFDFSKSDFGSCTPSDPENCEVERNQDGSCPIEGVIDSCLVGRCIQVVDDVPIFTCEGGDKEFIPVEDGGCEDGNSCTADDCEEDQGGECDYDSLSNIPCDDNNLCTAGAGICNLGVCEGELPLDGCITDEDCPSGVCFQQVGVCTCPPANNDNPCTSNLCGIAFQLGECLETNLPNACTIDADCGPGGDCVNNVCICEDGFPCTQDQVCVDAVCITNTFDDEDCQPPENICTMRSCTINGCETTLMNGLSPCTVIVQGNLCDGLIECVNGDPQDNDCIPNEPLEECTPIN
jgi:hypothetical protein